MNLHIDIETRSRCDLPSAGASRYGVDPTTQILMAAVSEEAHDAPVYLWVHPEMADAGVKSDHRALELLSELCEKDEIRAFNAPFEQAVIEGTEWFPIDSSLWRCTQAMARIAGMPDSLDRCGEALRIGAKKDRRGKNLIRHFSIPDELGKFNRPHDDPEKWAEFCEYCRQDVRAEKEIHRILRGKFDLKGQHLETFQFTQRMNSRGIPVNEQALHNAQAVIDNVQSNAGFRFQRLTGLQITQRAKVLSWLQARRVPIQDMQGDTLLALDRIKLAPDVSEVISLYVQLSYAAAKKVTTMLDWAMPDARMRGVFKYYGAGTGRWSAGGPQIQNAKKPTPEMRPLTKPAYAAICRGITAEGLSAIYGEPLEVIASCVRHFIHVPGQELLDADYNAIEARVICWLAGEKEMLAMWAKGADLYKRMASLIYNVPITAVNADQRDMGKRTILGCGYGMGAAKFLSTCQMYGVECDVALAERSVSVYRDAHPAITAYWRRLNRDAMAAVTTPGVRFNEFIVENAANRTYLFMRLPSGRRLAYPDPQIGDDPQFGQQLTYWGQIPMSVMYGRIKLYGGKLAENASQAVAADVMAHGARTAEQRGMPPFALIHDQALAVRNGHAPEEFAAALVDLPAWARGLPLKAEAKITPYYQK